MACPPEIASLLLEILYRSIAQIRSHSSVAAYCHAEADHVHDLPGLIRDYTPGRLVRYWDVDREAYLRLYPQAERWWVAPLWDKLSVHVDRARGQGGPR